MRESSEEWRKGGILGNEGQIQMYMRMKPYIFDDISSTRYFWRGKLMVCLVVYELFILIWRHFNGLQL